MQKFNQYGGNEMMDDAAMILNGFGKRCSKCDIPTQNKFITEGKCPVCSGAAPIARRRIDWGTNGGVQCDTGPGGGPCSCGAFH